MGGGGHKINSLIKWEKFFFSIISTAGGLFSFVMSFLAEKNTTTQFNALKGD